MRWARVEVEGSVRDALVEGDELSVVEGNAIEALTGRERPRPTGERIPLAGARLVAPLAARRNVMCVGWNYLPHFEERSRVHGERPLVMDMRAVRDFDHVIALFRRNGRWGAISKTNGMALRWRDPVYRSLRELAMSYFHEYTNRREHKTLREYSVSYDLRRVDPAIWVTGEKNAWHVAEALEDLRHFRLVNRRQEKTLARRDPFERKIGAMLQYPKPRARRLGRGTRRKKPAA